MTTSPRATILSPTIRSTGSETCLSNSTTSPGPSSRTSRKGISREPNCNVASSSMSQSRPIPGSTPAISFELVTFSITFSSFNSHSSTRQYFDYPKHHWDPCRRSHTQAALRDALPSSPDEPVETAIHLCAAPRPNVLAWEAAKPFPAPTPLALLHADASPETAAPRLSWPLPSARVSWRGPPSTASSDDRPRRSAAVESRSEQPPADTNSLRPAPPASEPRSSRTVSSLLQSAFGPQWAPTLASQPRTPAQPTARPGSAPPPPSARPMSGWPPQYQSVPASAMPAPLRPAEHPQ